MKAYPVTIRHYSLETKEFSQESDPSSAKISLKTKDLLPLQTSTLGENTLKANTKTYSDLQKSRQRKWNLKRLEHAGINSPYQVIRDPTQNCLKIKKTSEIIALEKCIARWKATKSRNQKITIGQMYSILKDKIIGDCTSDIWNLSIVLAKQINEIMEDPQKFKSRGVLVSPQGPVYPYYCFSKYRTEFLTIDDYTAWLEISDNQKEIELFIIFNKDALINAGTNKQIFEAQSFTIPLSVKKKYDEKRKLHLYERIGNCRPMVLVKPKPDCFFQIQKGIALHKKLVEVVPQSPIVSTFLPSKPLISDSSTIFYRQKKYNCNFMEASISNQVPLSSKKDSEVLPLTMLNILQEIIAIATTLIGWHKINIIHGDIKPENILLEVQNDNKTIKALLADFDFTGPAGKGMINQLYPYWDEVRHRGLVTPFVDVFGLCMTLGETLLPTFDSKTCDLFIDQYGQALFLAKMIEKHSGYSFTHIMEQNISYLLRHEKIETFIKNIEQKLNECKEFGSGEEKNNANRILKVMAATRAALKLIADVLVINRNLLGIDVQHFPVWELLFKNNHLFNSTKYEVLFQEIHNTFIFNRFFMSEVFNKISASDKKNKNFQAIKNELDQCKENPLLDQNELNKIQHLIEIRESALEVACQMKLLPSQDKEKYPLNYFLKNPLEMNPVHADFYLQAEIDKIDVTFGFKTLIETSTSSFNEPQNNRTVLKAKLKNIFNTYPENNFIRDEAMEILSQITHLENTMEYILEISNSYKKQIDDVMEQAMTMETFLGRLKEVQACLIDHETQEEKK